jgi:hypothetical protein
LDEQNDLRCQGRTHVCVQSAWETAKRTVWHPRCALVFERSLVVLFFFRHTSHSPEALNPQQNGFSVPRGELVASTERTLHPYDSDLEKGRFRWQMRATLWITPYSRLGRVVTGTTRLPAPFKPKTTLLKPHHPSQFLTKSRGDISPHL